MKSMALSFLFIVIVCFYPTVARSQSDIRARVEALERRIERLERAQSSPTAKLSPKRQDWRSLSMGMTTGQVRAVLGEPGKVDTNQYYTTWYWNYPSGGSVQFTPGGVVEAIREP
jgi:hypothetical protein